MFLRNKVSRTNDWIHSTHARRSQTLEPSSKRQRDDAHSPTPHQINFDGSTGPYHAIGPGAYVNARLNPNTCRRSPQRSQTTVTQEAKVSVLGHISLPNLRLINNFWASNARFALRATCRVFPFAVDIKETNEALIRGAARRIRSCMIARLALRLGPISNRLKLLAEFHRASPATMSSQAFGTSCTQCNRPLSNSGSVGSGRTNNGGS